MMTATTQPRTHRLTEGLCIDRRAPRVLVVEDDDEMRRWVAEVLEEGGFAVVTAPDALTAVMSLLAHGADVVVTDWKMPGFDGLRLMESMRAIAPRTPVILVTAYAEAGMHEKIRDHGGFGFLEKPFRGHDLVFQVKSALRSGTPQS